MYTIDKEKKMTKKQMYLIEETITSGDDRFEQQTLMLAPSEEQVRVTWSMHHDREVNSTQTMSGNDIELNNVILLKPDEVPILMRYLRITPCFKGTKKRCSTCEDLFDESQGRPNKYEPELWLCDDCHDKMMDRDEQ